MSDLEKELCFENYLYLPVSPRGRISSWDVPIPKCNLLIIVTAFRRAQLWLPTFLFHKGNMGNKEGTLAAFPHDHRLPGCFRLTQAWNETTYAILQNW